MMRSSDLLNRLEDRPFKPFRIHLSGGTLFDALDAGMVGVSASTAVLPRGFTADDEGRRIATGFRTISLVHIVQFSDMDEHEQENGKGHRRKRKK